MTRVVRLAVVVGLAVAVGLVAGQPPKPRKVAFLVGVGTYKHGLPPLGKAPLNDVAELAKELKAGGFDEVVTLTDADATKEAVEGQFAKLLTGNGDGKKAVGAGDLVLVLLCGHGFQADVVQADGKSAVSEPCFGGHDARLQDGVPVANTLVRLNGLISAAQSYGAKSLFLVDACREELDPNRGTGAVVKRGAGIQGRSTILRENVAVLYSCRAGQFSFQAAELRADGGHGLFSYALLTTVRAAGGDVAWGDVTNGIQKAM